MEGHVFGKEFRFGFSRHDRHFGTFHSEDSLVHTFAVACKLCKVVFRQTGHGALKHGRFDRRPYVVGVADVLCSEAADIRP